MLVVAHLTREINLNANITNTRQSPRCLFSLVAIDGPAINSCVLNFVQRAPHRCTRGI